MSEAGQKFVLWSKSEKPARESAVLDIDTGLLRRDHVLVLRSPQAEITLGLGAAAGALIDFAQNGETGGNLFLDACDEADDAIAQGDLAKSRDLGVPDVITTSEAGTTRRISAPSSFIAR